MSEKSEFITVPSSGSVLGNANAAIKSIFSEPLRSVLISSEVPAEARAGGAPASISFSREPFDFQAMEMAVGRTLEDTADAIIRVEKDPTPTPAEKTSTEADITSKATEEVLAAIVETINTPPAPPPNPPGPPGRPARQRRQSPPKPPIPVAAHFKLVFLCVFALTLLVGVVYIVLAVFVQSPTPAQTGATETMRTLLVAGVGLIFGLLGGKSIQ